MAIKYVVIPEQKKTIAILDDTKFDVINKIYKEFPDIDFSYRKYLMSNYYRAVVVCSNDDVYDVEEGKRQAKKKLLHRYHQVFDQKMAIFCAETQKLMFDMLTKATAIESKCKRNNVINNYHE